MQSICKISVLLVLSGCAGAGVAPYSVPMATGGAATIRPNAAAVYEPLAIGDSWKYVCNGAFTIVDRVIGTYHLQRHIVYALSLQIPSSPSKSIYEVQLLKNDLKGNTWIYGYVIHGKVRAVTPTEVVAAQPVLHQHYDYPAEKRGKISRVFDCLITQYVVH